MLRRLLGWLGAILGFEIGIAAGLYVTILVFGFSWLYLFGDNSWPSWSVILVALPMLVLPAFGATGGLLIGRRFASWLIASGYDTPLVRSWAAAALGLRCLLVSIVAAYVFVQQAQRMQQADHAQATAEDQQDSGQDDEDATAAAGGPGSVGPPGSYTAASAKETATPYAHEVLPSGTNEPQRIIKTKSCADQR